MSRRVVITGMGWVTPLGHDIDAVWARLTRGESGVGPVTRFDARTFKTNFAAEVKGFRLEDVLPAPSAKAHAGAGVSSQFALGAAARAWKHAGLDAWRADDGEQHDLAKAGTASGWLAGLRDAVARALR